MDKVRKGATQTPELQRPGHEDEIEFELVVQPDHDRAARQTNFTVATTKTRRVAGGDRPAHRTSPGEVNVRFKSETFPLDKMADIIGVDKIGNQQVGTGQNLQSAAGGTGSRRRRSRRRPPAAAAPG